MSEWEGWEGGEGRRKGERRREEKLKESEYK